MTKPTQPATTEDSPTDYGFCSWHDRFADDVRLIGMVEQGTGPGSVQYACGPCREAHGLVPMEDRP